MEYFKILQTKYPVAQYRVPHREFIETQMQGYIQKLDAGQCRSLVRGLVSQSYFQLGCGQDARASALYNKAEGAVNAWQKRARPIFAQRVDFRILKESVLMDIFTGRDRFPREVFEGLKRRLPRAAVRRLEAAVEKLRRQRTLQPRDVPERDKRDDHPELYDIPPVP